MGDRTKQRPVLQRQKSGRYARHRPEQTLLYQLVDQYFPHFLAALAKQGQHLPKSMRQEFEAYLKCGCLELGCFLRVRLCADRGHIASIVCR